MSANVLTRLHGFVRALRDNGVRVAQQEALDAQRALAALGVDAFASAESLKATLLATLIKQHSEVPIFERAFALHFAGAPAAGLLGPDLLEALEARGLSRDEALRAASRLLEGQGDLAASLLGGDAWEISNQLSAALERTDTAGLSSPLQVGYFSQRLLHELGLDDLEAQLARALERLGGEGRSLARGVVDERLLELRRLARQAVRAEYEKRNVRGPEAILEAALEERPFRALTASDEERMKRLIRRLCERLKTRVRRRQRRLRRGRLDLRRTLRRSLAFGGVPMRVVFHKRRPERPEIVVLCDVSDSVRAASGFMLQFVYALQELFRRVRSFVFVADLGEVSDLFLRYDVDEATRRVYAGEAISVLANSDYGAALRRFAGEHLESLNRRTTVVILGDGRTNYQEPEAWVLEEVRRRARHVVWLSPEGRGTWGTGDSRMPQYARHCDRVEVVRTVADLARVVDRLVL